MCPNHSIQIGRLIFFDIQGGATSLSRIKPSELKQHNSPDDAWSAFHGKVYNITPYLPFHPGGEKELMRVAGRDGTKLFGAFFRALSTFSLTERSCHTRLGQSGLHARRLSGRILGTRVKMQFKYSEDNLLPSPHPAQTNFVQGQSASESLRMSRTRRSIFAIYPVTRGCCIDN